jgi:hypothetical protein
VSETKRNSLHSAYRLETLNTLMLKEISNLLLYSKDLSSGKFLETAKVVEEDVFPNSREFHLKVCKELKENEVYTASAVYKEEVLGELVYTLMKLINLEFLLPRVEYVAGPPQSQERVDKLDDMRRSLSLRRNNSAVVLNRPPEVRTGQNMAQSIITSFTPRYCQPIAIGNPFNQLQQFISRSEVASPTLTKSSRISNYSNNFATALKTIR